MGQNQPIARACFICGSKQGEQVFSANIAVCGVGRVSYGGRCCAGCGLVLQDPVVSPETIQRQYEIFSNYAALDEGSPHLSGPAKRLLAIVQAGGVRAGRVYDVGAATGAMLWHFRKHGWAVSGCDPSPLAVSKAQSGNNIALDLGVGDQALAQQQGLDLITFSHVLEHIFDPPQTLRAAHAALAPDGHLALEVPCLIAAEINPPGLFMMEHLNYFDERSIANLLTRSGFDIVRFVITLDHFPFPAITVLARKTKARTPAPLRNGVAQSMEFCRTYAEIDRAHWARVDGRLREGVGAGEAVYVWGAGLHTSTLLERTDFGARAEVIAVVDRDPQKHGHAIGELPVAAPEQAIAGDAKIVISSYVSEAAIAGALLERNVPEERIVRLYA